MLMDESSGCRDEWFPDTPQSGEGGVEPQSKGIDSKILELVPGATAPIPGEAGNLQAYRLRCNVRSIAGILKAIGGEKEAINHLVTSRLLTHLKERQKKGKGGLFLTDGFDNYLPVRLTETGPIEISSAQFFGQGGWKVTLPEPPFKENSRIILREMLDVCCSSPAH